jgi:hypothetical protein
MVMITIVPSSHFLKIKKGYIFAWKKKRNTSFKTCFYNFVAYKPSVYKLKYLSVLEN